MATAAAGRWRAERIFFTGMPLAMLLAALIGFSRSFYLAHWTDAPQLSALFLVHGTLFTLWMLLLASQPALIAARRVSLHRRIGYWGFGLAAVLVIVAFWAGITALRRGATPAEGITAEAFFAIPVTEALSFAIFTGYGFLRRRDPDSHKRLMLLGSMALMEPSIGRFPLPIFQYPFSFMIAADLFLLAGILFDWRVRGRVHPVWIYGGALFVLIQYGRLPIAFSAGWANFAGLFA